MATFYSTPASVKTRTGIGPADLGLDDDAALDAFLEELLTEIADLMGRVMRTSYLLETVPAGLAGIASDAAADSVREMVATRQTPVVRIDDFAVRVIHSRILGPDMRERLKLYRVNGGAVSLDVTQPDISTAFGDFDWDSLISVDEDVLDGGSP